MSGGVSAEDREKALQAMREAHVGPECMMFALNALVAAGWRPGGAPARFCESGCGCRYATDDPDMKDCGCVGPCTMLDSAAWWNPPAGAPARPTREALAEALYKAEDTLHPFETPGLWLYVSEFSRGRWYKVADALRAADHLWAEQTADAGVNAHPMVEASVGQPSRSTPSGIGAGLPDANTAAPASAPPLFTVEAELRPAMPSAPVVDREALARRLFERAIAQFPESSLTWDDTHQDAWRAEASAIIDALPFVDRATVEAETYARAARETDAAWTGSSGVAQRALDAARADQREKDAQIVRGMLAGSLGVKIAAAICAGAATQDARLPEEGR